MNLKLEKQKVVKLSPDAMSNVNGGGKNRSNRLGGDCRYSRNHQINDGSPDGPTIGCHGKGDVLVLE